VFSGTCSKGVDKYVYMSGFLAGLGMFKSLPGHVTYIWKF
jgi:hypothetical protein